MIEIVNCKGPVDWVQEEECEFVPQLDIDMGKVRTNIMAGLVGARRTCEEQNVITCESMIAIINALFYLVERAPRVDIGYSFYEDRELVKYEKNNQR